MTGTTVMFGRLVLIAIAAMALGVAAPVAHARADDDQPIYVSKAGLACILKLAPIYLASSNEIARIGLHSCDHGADDNLPATGEGQGGAGASFGSGIGRLDQVVGGASRSAQATNTITATNRIAVSKDQLRCIVAEAGHLPTVKDAFGNDVIRLDTLDCMKTS